MMPAHGRRRIEAWKGIAQYLGRDVTTVRRWGEALRARAKMRARSVQFKSYDAEHEIVPSMREDVVQWLTRAADEH